MKWKVATSMASRLLVMLFTVAVVLMVTNKIGAEGQGTAALVQLGILLIVSITNFIGGGAVVYLLPRIGTRPLVLPAYVWSTAIAGIFYGFFQLVPIVPEEFVLDVVILGWLQAMFTFHLQILVGQERIHRFNVIVTLQAFWLAAMLAYLIFGAEAVEIRSYINALYVSFGMTYLIALFSSWKHMMVPSEITPRAAFDELWKFGRYAQLGNILQLLTYRSNIWIVEKLIGLSASGIYSLSLYASESIWNVGKSLALVQGARIANTNDDAYNRQLTSKFMKLSISGSVVLIGIMLALPDRFYQWLFGEEMAGLYWVLLWVSPGILANACSMIYSHYFSGVGLHRNNTIGSGAGLAALLIVVYPLITNYGVEGGAMAASVAYIIQLITMGILFRRGSNR
ncbi:lipopolysaccharide biosynthesis protein [Sanyastnella coralliicola]|uniref:lipopolysaccharide biosynthesis protein n=1 Tax=Sanyastnella coralliicola TaxID=3069118 RepID=UPI0027BAC84E|nr:polysaccharide biosynthesis C-terminal domain-containing protein [Longitalea sp. SCSIO 12813]